MDALRGTPMALLCYYDHSDNLTLREENELKTEDRIIVWDIINKAQSSYKLYSINEFASVTDVPTNIPHLMG